MLIGVDVWNEVGVWEERGEWFFERDGNLQRWVECRACGVGVKEMKGI